MKLAEAVELYKYSHRPFSVRSGCSPLRAKLHPDENIDFHRNEDNFELPFGAEEVDFEEIMDDNAWRALKKDDKADAPYWDACHGKHFLSVSLPVAAIIGSWHPVYCIDRENMLSSYERVYEACKKDAELLAEKELYNEAIQEACKTAHGYSSIEFKTFSKFDFWSRMQKLYDSPEQADADLNDREGFLPVLLHRFNMAGCMKAERTKDNGVYIGSPDKTEGYDPVKERQSLLKAMDMLWYDIKDSRKFLLKDCGIPANDSDYRLSMWCETSGLFDTLAGFHYFMESLGKCRDEREAREIKDNNAGWRWLSFDKYGAAFSTATGSDRYFDHRLLEQAVELLFLLGVSDSYYVDESIRGKPITLYAYAKWHWPWFNALKKRLHMPEGMTREAVLAAGLDIEGKSDFPIPIPYIKKWILYYTVKRLIEGNLLSNEGVDYAVALLNRE